MMISASSMEVLRLHSTLPLLCTLIQEMTQHHDGCQKGMWNLIIFVIIDVDSKVLWVQRMNSYTYDWSKTKDFEEILNCIDKALLNSLNMITLKVSQN